MACMVGMEMGGKQMDEDGDGDDGDEDRGRDGGGGDGVEVRMGKEMVGIDGLI